MVRGMVLPVTMTFQAFSAPLGNVYSALAVGLLCIGAALWATTRVHETFHTDMDFIER
ncbi:MAG: hypothetical protein MUE88_10340 [Flavobacteriales bacterium]|nr:hypothetical protein [Flavobacteriales bacterium]